MGEISLETVYELAHMGALALTEQEAIDFLPYLKSMEQEAQKLVKEENIEFSIHDLVDESHEYTMRTGDTTSLHCLSKNAPMVIGGLICSPPVLVNEE